MDYRRIRRLSLMVFIGFLGLTALIAIISVLAGEFGEVQLKILATTFTISAASICAMSCAAFIEKKKLMQFGVAGILLSVAAAMLLIAGLWPEIDSEGYWKTTVTLGVFAVAFAHAFLLVLPELDQRQKWVQPVSSVSIGILALQIVVAVWGEIDAEGYYRLLAVVAIIVGLETLVIPILMKLRRKNGRKSEKVVLERIEGDVYRDSAGKRYRLTEIDTEPDSGP
jgi:hypothetical protein